MFSTVYEVNEMHNFENVISSVMIGKIAEKIQGDQS